MMEKQNRKTTDCEYTIGYSSEIVCGKTARATETSNSSHIAFKRHELYPEIKLYVLADVKSPKDLESGKAAEFCREVKKAFEKLADSAFEVSEVSDVEEYSQASLLKATRKVLDDTNFIKSEVSFGVMMTDGVGTCVAFRGDVRAFFESDGFLVELDIPEVEPGISVIKPLDPNSYVWLNRNEVDAVYLMNRTIHGQYCQAELSEMIATKRGEFDFSRVSSIAKAAAYHSGKSEKRDARDASMIGFVKTPVESMTLR